MGGKNTDAAHLLQNPEGDFGGRLTALNFFFSRVEKRGGRAGWTSRVDE